MNAQHFMSSDGIYLLSHSIGLMPKSTKQAIAGKYLEPWSQADATVWSHWLQALDNFRHSVGELLNTDKKNICPQTNLSSALTKILSSLPRRQAKTFLLSEADFPSMAYVFEKMRPEDYSISYLPKDADLTDINVWESALSKNVNVVLLTHVQSMTGRRIPVADITRLARAKNIFSIVDVAQSAGVIPIDLQTWQADFVLGSSVKWLCGGPGAAFLWVQPELLPTLQPRDVGWFSHADPFAFDIHHFDYAEDALRFLGGTPSVVPFIVADNSLRLLLDIGIDTIHRHNLQCKQTLIKSISPELLLSPVDTSKQGGTLVIRHSEEVESQLKHYKVHFDARAQGIRLSPHIYTTEEELTLVAEALNKTRAC